MDEDEPFFLEDVEEAARNKAKQADPEYKSYLEDLQAVVKTPAGARVICSWLETLGAVDPVWSEKNAKLIRRAILIDIANMIFDDLATASPEAHDDIQRMMRIRRKQHEALRT